MPVSSQIVAVIRMIEEVARDFNLEGDEYFVGGYPRSMAMGLSLADVHDLDVASGTPQRAAQLAGFVAEAAKAQNVSIHHRTPTTTMLVAGVEVDFQGAQAHEEVVPYLRIWRVADTPIARNIFDRDFTMNALALRFGETEILDLTRRGVDDINDGRVVSILPPEVSVPKNPLMITRAVKFACRYGFSIDKALWEAMKGNSKKISSLSPERMAIEAYVLSQYPAARDMLVELNLKELASPAEIEKGQGFAEDDNA